MRSFILLLLLSFLVIGCESIDTKTAEATPKTPKYKVLVVWGDNFKCEDFEYIYEKEKIIKFKNCNNTKKSIYIPNGNICQIIEQ